MKLIITGVFLVTSSLFLGCAREEPGPLERAGMRADEIADNVKEGERPLKRKGPLERAGESIDEAFDGDRR